MLILGFDRSVELGAKRRMLVPLAHEAGDPIKGFERRRLAFAKPADESGVVERVASEPRFAHVVPRAKSFDLGDQLVLGWDLHGRVCSLIKTTAQAGLLILSTIVSPVTMLDNANMADAPGAGSNPMYDALMAVKPVDLSLSAWAARAGIHRSIFNGIRAHGNPTADTLQKLLDAIDLSLTDLYGHIAQGDAANALVRTEVKATGMAARDVERAWRGPEPQKPVPLLGTAFGGEWSDGVEMTELHLTEILDYVGRPQAVAGDANAYAVEFVGDSMVPRYEPRERAVVSPRAPVRPGDDVIVQLRSSEAAPAGDDRMLDPDHLNRVTLVLVKRLVKRTPKFVELEQFNPPMRFQVPIERVAAVHRIMVRF